ncbi:MAG: hypothetical protein L3J21_09930 [Devosiaceae bacterium]|nr:hypothetical protein [Devosiaceae bacterium]
MKNYLEKAKETEGLEGYSDYEITEALHSMYRDETGTEVPFEQFSADAGLILRTEVLSLPPEPGGEVGEVVVGGTGIDPQRQGLSGNQPLPSHPIPEDMQGAPTLTPQPPYPGFGTGESMWQRVNKKIEERRGNVATTAGAGIAQGTLGLGEAALRTPQSVNRILGSINEFGQFLGVPEWMTKKRFKNPIDVIEHGFKVGDFQIEGTTDAADKIRGSMQILPEMFEPFQVLSEKSQEADTAFQKAIKGNFEQLGDVVTDPQAWAGFIGQAVPSLYAAWKSGGSLPFVGWLEAMQAAGDADQYEEITGEKMSDAKFATSTILVGTVNGLLEKAGINRILKGNGSALERFFTGGGWEGGTEGLQAVVGNVGKMLYDPDAGLSQGVLPGVMGGFATGGALSAGQRVHDKRVQKRELSEIEKDFITPKEYPDAAQEQARQAGDPVNAQFVMTTPKQEEIEQKIIDTREFLQTAGERQKAEAEKNLKRLEETLTVLKAEGITEETLRGELVKEIQEKRGGKPLAESKTLAPSKPDKVEVAPTKDGAAPKPIKAAPKEIVKEVKQQQIMPETVQVGPASTKTTAISNNKTSVYRETAPNDLYEILMVNKQGGNSRMFVSDDESLALGQGENKGAIIEMRGDYVSGLEHKKVGAGVIGGKEYQTNYVAKDAIKKITVKSGQKITRGLTNSLLRQGFVKTQLNDGTRIFTPKKAIKKVTKKKPKTMRQPKGEAEMKAKPSDLPDELASYSPGVAHQPLYQDAVTVGYEAPESGIVKIGKRIISMPNKAKPMRRESIRIALINIIGPRLYEGKVKGKGRLGFYRPDNSAIRIKRYGDVEVMAHEMAHYLDFHYKYKREFSKIYNSPDVVNEVKNLSYDISTTELSKVEGFAEFVRLWLTRYESAKAQAPRFVDQFEAVLAKDKKLSKKMLILQEKMHQWYFQGSEARLTAVMDGNKLNLKEKLDYVLHRRPTSMLKQRYVDHIHAAKVIERETKGKLLDATESAYKQLQLINGIEGIFAESTKHGAPYFDKDGAIQFKGPSLEDVFRFSISSGAEIFNLHQEYFAARRAKELKEQGRENLFDEGMIKAGLGHAKKYPWFAESFKKYQEYRKNLMSFMVDTGYLDKNAALNMLEVNKNYVPFNRVVEGIGESFSGAGKSNFKRLKGGTQNIQNIYNNIVMGDFQHIKGALQAKALRQMFEAGLKSQNGSQFFSKIDSDSELVKAQVDQMAGKVAEAMGALGVTITNGGLVNSGNIDGTIVDQEQIIKYFEKNPEELMFWTFGNMPKTAETKVTSFISSKTGKRVWVEIQREAEMVVDMLDNLNGWALPDGLAGKALGFAYTIKNMQTVLITSMPQFSIPNLVRDIQTATMVSGGKFKPVYHNMLGFASMLGHGLGKNTAYTEMLRNGGGWAGRVRSAMDETRGQSNHRMPGRWKKPELFLTNILELYIKLVDSPEMSTRAGYYIQQRREGTTAREAAWGAREISTDFRKHGSYAAFVMLQRTIPFHGAFVQSVDRDIRAFAEKDGETKFSNLLKTESGRLHINDLKVRMAAVAAGFAAITLLLASMNEDEDFYQDLTEDQRVRFFHIKIDGVQYQIPKPHGFFSMMLQGVETFMDYLTQKEGADAAKVMAFSLAYNLNDQFIPGVINPHVEIALNKTFSGAPIVPKGLDRVSSYLQYSQNTPQLYVAIGESLNISPAKARHIARGYFGYFENFISDTAELALWNESAWGERPFKSGAKQYFGKQFIPREVPFRTRWTEKYYDLKARAVTARADISVLKKRLPLNSKLLLKIEDKTTQLLSSMSNSFGKVDKYIADSRESSMAIKYDKELLAVDKENKINALRKEKNEIMKSFYKSINVELALAEKIIKQNMR